MTTRVENEDILHLLTGRTPLNINRLLSQYLRMAGVSLTKEQWSLMAVLWKTDGLTQQSLADATYRDRPGVTRLLDNLEKDGFIERRPHATDRRTNLIFLTKKGRSVRNDVVKALKDTVAAATENISDKQLDNIRTVFEQINRNIEKHRLN